MKRNAIFHLEVHESVHRDIIVKILVTNKMQL